MEWLFVFFQATALVSGAVVRPPQSIAEEGIINQWIQNASPLSNTTAVLADVGWDSALSDPSSKKRYTCDGRRFGRGLNAQSCLNAWKQIPDIGTELTFGPRNTDEEYDVYLPKMYLSCRWPR